MNESLLFDVDKAVAILTINDEPYNRMSLDFMDELESAVKEIASNKDIRAVVLTSAGLENFSVGMNLKQFPEGVKKMGSADDLFDQRLKVISEIENMNKPWICLLYTSDAADE